MEDSKVIPTDNPSPKHVSRVFGIKIIKVKFQFKFAVVIFVFLSFAAGLMWIQGRVAVQSFIDSGYLVDSASIDGIQLINSIVGKTAIMALAIVFALSLIFSHLMAGPIYRFEKTLEEMQKGNLNVRIKLRKWDEFKETADLFVKALASLRLKIKKERDTVETATTKLASVAESLRGSGQADAAGEIDKVVDSLKNSPKEINI